MLAVPSCSAMTTVSRSFVFSCHLHYYERTSLRSTEISYPACWVHDGWRGGFLTCPAPRGKGQVLARCATFLMYVSRDPVTLGAGALKAGTSYHWEDAVVNDPSFHLPLTGAIFKVFPTSSPPQRTACSGCRAGTE